MKSIVNYTDSSDQELYSQKTIQLKDYKIQLSAATIASTPEKPNEDAFAITYGNDILYAAVFDGATSLKPIKTLGSQTGAHFASHFLKNKFAQTEIDDSPKDLMLKLNQQLLVKSLHFKEASLSDTHTLPSSTGTIIKIDAAKNALSFAHVSDSFGIAYFADGHSSIFTADKNSKFDEKIFALIIHIAKEKSIPPRMAREDEAVKKALIEMYIKRNNNPTGTGCGVINGDPQIEHYIQTGTLTLQGIKAILIGTDGLIPVGWSEKKENDRQKLFDEIQKDGFQKLFKIKKQREDADSDWNYIRYKHSDDATGILITL